MTKIWDDLKKNISDWSNVAVEKAEEMSKLAVAKTEELTRISKIKIEIRQLQRDIDKTYEEIGRYVRKNVDDKKFDFKGDENLSELLAKLVETESVIKGKESKVQEIKEEFDLKQSEIDAEESEEEPVTAEEVVAEAKTEKKKAKAKKTKKTPEK